jgi:hypothetical protein
VSFIASWFGTDTVVFLMKYSLQWAFVAVHIVLKTLPVSSLKMVPSFIVIVQEVEGGLGWKFHSPYEDLHLASSVFSQGPLSYSKSK